MAYIIMRVYIALYFPHLEVSRIEFVLLLNITSIMIKKCLEFKMWMRYCHYGWCCIRFPFWVLGFWKVPILGTFQSLVGLSNLSKTDQSQSCGFRIFESSSIVEVLFVCHDCHGNFSKSNMCAYIVIIFFSRI